MWIVEGVVFVAGMLIGILIGKLNTGKKINMYKTLWENERNGNIIMTKKLSEMKHEEID